MKNERKINWTLEKVEFIENGEVITSYEVGLGASEPVKEQEEFTEAMKKEPLYAITCASWLGGISHEVLIPFIGHCEETQ